MALGTLMFPWQFIWQAVGQFLMSSFVSRVDFPFCEVYPGLWAGYAQRYKNLSTFFINQIRIKIVHMTGGAFQFNQIMRQFQYGDKLYGNFLGTFLKKIRNFRISERDHFTENSGVGSQVDWTSRKEISQNFNSRGILLIRPDFFWPVGNQINGVPLLAPGKSRYFAQPRPIYNCYWPH